MGNALVAIGKPSVPALVEALGSYDVVVRARAAVLLGRLSAVAGAATPALERKVADAGEDDEVRREAAKALKKIRGT